MFVFYDCRLAAREQFQMEFGSQPKNALFYLLEGAFRYRFEGEWQIATANELLCFPESAVFERHVVSPIRFYYLRFDNPQHESLPCGSLHLSNHVRLNSSLQYLARLEELPATEKNPLQQHFFEDVWYQLQADQLMHKRNATSIENKAAEYLQMHLQEKVLLPELARQMNCSVSGLSAKFCREFGVPPMQYLNELRIRKAKQLLCDTDLTMAEIAVRCGFSNAYFFSNTFKKQAQVAPSEYRKRRKI